MSFITQQRENLSPYRQGREAVDQPLYDFAELAPSDGWSSPIELFAVPRGGKCPWPSDQPTKSLADTNMDLPHQLPAPQEFLIQRIKLLTSGKDRDRMHVTWKGSELWIGSKRYMALPLLRLALEPYALDAKLLLPQDMRFGVSLYVPELLTGSRFRIGIELGGMLYRRPQ